MSRQPTDYELELDAFYGSGMTEAEAAADRAALEIKILELRNERAMRQAQCSHEWVRHYCPKCGAARKGDEEA